jgi:glycosyltransferase involved in cell wall biosynthesis
MSLKGQQKQATNKRWKPLEVAILYSHLKEQGGAENVILKQVDLLHHSGHRVKCYFSYVDRKFLKPTSNPHCYVDSYFQKSIPNSKTMRIILSIPLAPMTLKALKDADVLLCHGYGPTPWIGYVLKKLKGLKYVCYIHSPPRFLYMKPEDRNLWRFDGTRDILFQLGKFARPFIKELDSRGVLNSEKVLVNSRFTGRRVKSIYGVEPIVCYPPVDTHSFKLLGEETIKKTRAGFGWPLILATGRLAAVKRWEWLIGMMPYITKVFPSATLAVTGEITRENKDYVQKLARLAHLLDVEKNVRFLGFKTLPELVQLYNAADVYVYPVPQEDFGLGPVEAMACGTPAIVWDDNAGPCESVIEGETGFRAKPYDIGDFAEKTVKAVDLDKWRRRSYFHKFVEENFSSENHLQTLEKTLYC